MTEPQYVGKCWSCKGPLTALEYGRGESCPHCGRDTKVCVNCDFYERSAHNQCREPQADRVVEKERSNFCDYFRPRATVGGAGTVERPSAADLKAAAEALFKKKP